MPEPPDNSRLVLSIEKILSEPHDLEANLRPFLGELLGSTLIVARDDDLVTVDSEDGDLYLALFTDPIELHMFEPGLSWELIGAEEALRQVVSGEVDGVAINPRGRTFELSREDILDFFDFD